MPNSSQRLHSARPPSYSRGSGKEHGQQYEPFHDWALCLPKALLLISPSRVRHIHWNCLHCKVILQSKLLHLPSHARLMHKQTEEQQRTSNHSPKLNPAERSDQAWKRSARATHAVERHPKQERPESQTRDYLNVIKLPFAEQLYFLCVRHNGRRFTVPLNEGLPACSCFPLIL